MNKKRFATLLLRILQVGLPIALLTPFLYVPAVTFPFVTAKVWVFRSIVELLIPVWLALLVVAPERRPKKEPLLIGIAIYGVALMLSSLFGVDFHRSFWANHERMTGTYALLHYVAYAFMVATAFATRREWFSLFLFSIVGSVAMAGVALWERSYGILASNPGGRVWATLGNYIYLANFMLFNMYFVGLVLLRRSLKLWMQTALWGVAFLQLLIIFFTETRGSILAMVAAGLIMLFWEAVSVKRVRGYAVGALLVCVLAGGLLVANRTNPVVVHLPLIGKLANTNLTDGGVRTRFIAWHIALQAFQARPVFGWGPENFYYAFNQFYNPESYHYSTYETWFDRPHNNLLDVLSTTGGVGMAAFISLFVLSIITIRRKTRSGVMSKWEGILTVAMLFAYILQNITVFDSHTSYLYFFLVLGFIAGIRTPELIAENGSAAEMRVAYGTLGGLGMVALFLVFYTNVLPYQAAHLGLLATSYARLGSNVVEAKRYYDEALATPTQHRVDLRIDAARDIADIVGGGAVPQNMAAPYYDWAIALLEQNVQERPKDVYDQIALGQIYMFYSGIKPEMLLKARDAFARALVLSPRRQQIIFSQVRLAVTMGDLDEALRLLEGARADEERIPELHWLLTFVHWQRQDVANAQLSLKRTEELQYKWHGPEDISLVYKIHKTAGDLEGSFTAANTLIANWPTEGQYFVWFAQAVLDTNRDLDIARQALQKARELGPATLEPDVRAIERQLSAMTRP